MRRLRHSSRDAATPVDGEPRRVELDVEVRYVETDAMGVVHHSNYLHWFEYARTKLCELAGLHYAEIERAGYGLMVTGAELQYRQGARYGDTVTVTVRLSRLGSRVAHFEYEVRRDGVLLTTGTTHHVWIRFADSRPCRIPEIARPLFESLAGRRLVSARSD
jgi:acyl-CoA thioester hydrolase